MIERGEAGGMTGLRGDDSATGGVNSERHIVAGPIFGGVVVVCGYSEMRIVVSDRMGSMVVLLT
jgi:hypothetical protein